MEKRTYLLVPKKTKKVSRIFVGQWKKGWAGVEFNNIRIYEWLGEGKCPFKIGDLIKVAGDDRGLALRKQYIPVRRREYSSMAEDAFLKLELTRFLSQLKPESIQKAKQLLSEIYNPDESVYRVFYHSFKMYRYRRLTQEAVLAMLELVGRPLDSSAFNDPDIVHSHLANCGFSWLLCDLVRDIISTEFTLDRNDKKAWKKDAVVLGSSFYFVTRGFDFIIRFCERILSGALWSQTEGNRFLSWDEAGAMEVYDVMGILRRPTINDEFKTLLAAAAKQNH
jgi:hypothetical protein